MKEGRIILLILASFLVSCADAPIKQSLPFQILGRNHLYDKAKWGFSGRLAFTDKDNSLSASIHWKHLKNFDEVELAGPFGQGRTIIRIANNNVAIDYGEEAVRFIGSADDLMRKYTGVSVPVLALRYWVLGLVDPKNSYVSAKDGFIQLGWNVSYQQMQLVELDEMPKKIKVKQDDSKLKLIIDHWDI